MRITREFLVKNHACVHGLRWFDKYEGSKDLNSIIDALIADNKHYDAIWLISKALGRHDMVKMSYVIANSVKKLYTQKYDDGVVDKMLDLLKEHLENPERILSDKALYEEILKAIEEISISAEAAIPHNAAAASAAKVAMFSGFVLTDDNTKLAGSDFSTVIEKAAEAIYYSVYENLEKSLNSYDASRIAMTAKYEAIEVILEKRFYINHCEEEEE